MQAPERYGAVKITKLRAAVNELRAAIQSEGTPRIEVAWERAENWVDRIFRTEAPMEWRDIATAPQPEFGQEGRYILGFVPDGEAFELSSCISVVWWEPKVKGGCWWCDGDFQVHPTHWMPLPAPPTEGK